MSKKVQLTLAIIKLNLTPFRFAVLNIRDLLPDAGFVIADTKEDMSLDRGTKSQLRIERDGGV